MIFAEESGVKWILREIKDEMAGTNYLVALLESESSGGAVIGIVSHSTLVIPMGHWNCALARIAAHLSCLMTSNEESGRSSRT